MKDDFAESARDAFARRAARICSHAARLRSRIATFKAPHWTWPPAMSQHLT